MYDLAQFQVGDEFEDSPHVLGQIISAVLAEGGTFDMDGGSVVITSLPNRKPIKVVPEFGDKEEWIKIVEALPKEEIKSIDKVEVVKVVPIDKEEVVKAAPVDKEEIVKVAPKTVGRPKAPTIKSENPRPKTINPAIKNENPVKSIQWYNINKAAFKPNKKL